MSIIYCNECFSVYSESNRNFVITSCTHMYCNDCLIKGAVANQICRVCRASCRITQINDQMPSDVLPYLKSCDMKFKRMCNVVRYQDNRRQNFMAYSTAKMETLTNQLLVYRNDNDAKDKTISELTAELNKLRQENNSHAANGRERKSATPKHSSVASLLNLSPSAKKGFFTFQLSPVESTVSTLFPGFRTAVPPPEAQAVEGNENASQMLNMPSTSRPGGKLPKIALRRHDPRDFKTPPNDPYADYMSEVSQSSLSRRTDGSSSFVSATDTTPTSRRRHRMEAIPRNVVTPMRPHWPWKI